MIQLRLKKGKEEAADRFHPWVFSGALAYNPMLPSKDASKPTSAQAHILEEGDTVEVLANDGRLIGVGHYQSGSIAVRLMRFTPGAIDADFYLNRLQSALRLRKALGLARPDNNAYRLVHGEGDFIPGLVVDIYGTTAVMQAHSTGIHRDRQLIADQLMQLPDLLLKNVYYKSENTVPFKEDIGAENGYLIGGAQVDDVVMENGLKFRIDWLRGQKTGFFLDQRDNRTLVENYARGRNVLNMFCYTGGFSVYALRGGAKSVDSVDSSSLAIEATNANIALNFNQCQTKLHRSFAQDAFSFLQNMPSDHYDLVILDPPAFAKHRSAIPRALQGYRRLNILALQRIAPGGFLFTFSCSQAVSPEQFRLAVFTAATQARRKVRILHELSQPADHPVNICHPEGEYLKGLVLYVE